MVIQKVYCANNGVVDDVMICDLHIIPPAQKTRAHAHTVCVSMGNIIKQKHNVLPHMHHKAHLPKGTSNKGGFIAMHRASTVLKTKWNHFATIDQPLTV
jgi:Fe2+ or Zn2+ uptake regulation protein